MPGPESDSTSRRTIAEKIDHLFDVVRPPGDEEREYTNKEAVKAVVDAGTPLSESHFSELRRGISTNPSVRVLEGVAAFFGVRSAYFLDDPQVTEEVEAELAVRVAMRRARVRDIALRAAGLDPQERTAMHRLMAQIISEHDSGEHDSE